MKILNGSLTLSGLLVLGANCLNAQTVPLGTAGNFAVLGASTVTNTGNSIVSGNLGVSPGCAVTGFGPGIVINGTINACNAVSAQGQSDLTVAYNNAAGRACPGPPLPGDLGGTVITPGVYCSASSVGITGTVTLSGNGVFVFQIGSTLTTAAGNSVVNLIGGAQASNVFWQVGSSATLGTNTVFNGTVMALASVTVNTGAVLNGRALARTGAVTLAGNAITSPVVAGGGGTPTLACSFPSGQVGVAYSSALIASGGTPPFTYSLSGGNLPGGLFLNASTGVISGTPTVAGAFNDTSRVVDSLGASSTSSCGITIAPAVPPFSALSLTCAANFGVVGQPYLSSLVAAGGTTPYTYTISSGNLPAGLALLASSGAITGTPTTAGNFNYTAVVTDSASVSATNNCGPVIVTNAPPPGVPAPTSLILALTGFAMVTIILKRDALLKRFRRD